MSTKPTFSIFYFIDDVYVITGIKIKRQDFPLCHHCSLQEIFLHFMLGIDTPKLTFGVDLVILHPLF